MTILPLVIAPDPRLKQKSEIVEKIDDDIRKLIDDMVDTMRYNDGVGLAAVQVGVHKRILVMEIQDQETGKNKIYHVVNPIIIKESKDTNEYEEGCLSVPGQRSTIIRPKTVTVEYFDYHGKKQTLECDELLATCIQHEIDHLNGVIFPDHLSKLKRDRIIKKSQKYKKDHNIK